MFLKKKKKNTELQKSGMSIWDNDNRYLKNYLPNNILSNSSIFSLIDSKYSFNKAKLSILYYVWKTHRLKCIIIIIIYFKTRDLSYAVKTMIILQVIDKRT
jgi:hypothetical protein